MIILKGRNGMKYAVKEKCEDKLSVSLKNDKVGNILNLSFSIEYTCRKDCECYKLQNCYGCNGRYNMDNVQICYTKNFNFYVNNSSNVFITELSKIIKKHKTYKIFRFFNVGDLVDIRMFQCICALADLHPDIKFYFYTKKYDLVNKAVDMYGNETYLPLNLTIIFSHWLNEDGTYLPMENPYNFPTSEFIPLGKEELANTVNHICPCSDPNINSTCETCDNPCYNLKYGQSMALLEHSTKRTRKRDKIVRTAKKLLKKVA